MEKIIKNNKTITITLISLLLFARCDLGIVYSKVMVMINVAIIAVSMLYCIYRAWQRQLAGKKDLVQSLFNPAVAWLFVFTLLVFIYGHWNIGTPSDFYSRQFALLTVVPPVIILFLLWDQLDELTDILAKSGAIVIIATFITGIVYDDCYTEWFDGVFARVGKTPAGTSVDAGNLYIVLLVPVLYQLLVKKEIKKYAFASIVGIVGIILTGAKAAMIPLVLVVTIMMLGAAKDKKTLFKSIIILLVLFIVAIILCMTVPLLYDIVGDRFVELFTGVNDTEYDLHTSTGQRMAVIAAFKEHFWEAPIWGHGFYAFKSMPYSQLEEYKVDGVAMYRNIQIHMNYLEILFSYGVVGFIAYYWFPVKLGIESIISKMKETRLIGVSYLLAFAFIDLGLDMYYKYMTPYFVYLVVFLYIKRSKKS